MNGTQQAGTLRRVYRYKVWREAFFLIVVVAFGVGGLAISSQNGNSFSQSLLILYALFLAFAIYLLVLASRSYLEIDGNRIEVRRDFSLHSATLSEIEGFRSVHTRNGYYQDLILKDGRGTIDISEDYDTDSEFRSWFQQIPDLDKRDHDAIIAEIEKQTDLGSTPQERLGSLKAAWQIAAALMGIEALAAVGLNFAPVAWHELSVALLVLAPFTAAYLCWRSPLLYAVFRRRSDPRADFGYALMIAGFGLCFFTSELHFVSIDPLLPGMGLMVLAVAFTYYQPARNGGRHGAFLGVLCLAAIYAYGAVAVTDIVFDRSAPTQYSTRVLESETLRGRYGSTSYRVRLAPWGPYEEEEEIGFSSSEFYPNVDGGGTVCFNLSRGWLTAPWFRVADCDALPIGGNQDGVSDVGNGDTDSEGVYHIGKGISAPQPLNTVEAEFSEEARRANYQGICLIQMVVDAQGNPQNPRVIRPLGMGLDEKALEAVKKYRFRPAMKDGHIPVPVRITVEVNFRLN